MNWQQDQYWPGNHPVAIERFKRVGLFPSVDPPATDRDGDGLPDAWEAAHGLNPDEPADAARDADGDGAGNREEWQAGTDPNDPRSRLALVVGRAEAGVVLSFTAMAGRAYTVQWSPRIGPASWSDLFAVPAAPTNRIESLDAEPIADVRFYRVRTVATP